MVLNLKDSLKHFEAKIINFFLPTGTYEMLKLFPVIFLALAKDLLHCSRDGVDQVEFEQVKSLYKKKGMVLHVQSSFKIN